MINKVFIDAISETLYRVTAVYDNGFFEIAVFSTWDIAWKYKDLLLDF